MKKFAEETNASYNFSEIIKDYLLFQKWVLNKNFFLLPCIEKMDFFFSTCPPVIVQWCSVRRPLFPERGCGSEREASARPELLS